MDEETAKFTPLLCNQGEGLRLLQLLQEALGIPDRARRFTVTFAAGEPVVVSVEYLPQTKENHV
jgi:hypothetical protein